MKIKPSFFNFSYLPVLQQRFNQASNRASNLPLPNRLAFKVLKIAQPILLSITLLFATAAIAATIAVLSSSLPPLFILSSFATALIALCCATAWALLRINHFNWKKRAASDTKRFLANSILSPSPPPQETRFLKTYASFLEKISLTQNDLLDPSTKTAFSLEQLNRFIASLALYSPHLKQIEFNGVSLQQADLTPLHRHSFTSVAFVNCEIEDSQLKTVLTSSKKIQEVTLIDCHKLTAAALQPLTNSKLKKLTLEGCRLAPLTIEQPEKAIQEWVQEQISQQKDLQQMQQIYHKARLMRHHIIDKADATARASTPLQISSEQLQCLSSCKKLKELTISHIDEKGLEDILTTHRGLEKLTISHSPLLSGRALAAAIKKKPTLELLQLGTLPLLDKSFFEELAIHPCPENLQLLLPVKDSSALLAKKEEVDAIKNLLKIHYKWVAKPSSPVDLEGIWRRRF